MQFVWSIEKWAEYFTNKYPNEPTKVQELVEEKAKNSPHVLTINEHLIDKYNVFLSPFISLAFSDGSNHEFMHHHPKFIRFLAIFQIEIYFFLEGSGKALLYEKSKTVWEEIELNEKEVLIINPDCCHYVDFKGEFFVLNISFTGNVGNKIVCKDCEYFGRICEGYKNEGVQQLIKDRQEYLKTIQ